jgi:hypothetical protein
MTVGHAARHDLLRLAGGHLPDFEALRFWLSAVA